MAIVPSNEHDELVLTSTRANVQDAMSGLLNGMIASSLPSGTASPPPGVSTCDRTTSVTAQATSLHGALSELIDELLDAIDSHEGGIRGVELHGVMTGPDHCTIWGQACLDEPAPYRRLEATALIIDQNAANVSITVTLRAGS